MNTQNATNPGTTAGVAQGENGGQTEDQTNGHDTDDQDADEDFADSEDTSDENDQGDDEDGEGAGDDEGGEGDDGPQAAEPETVEVEHDGQKFKVPAALKDSFLRQADYTQKTQQLAQDRRDFEVHQTASREHIRDMGKLYAIHETIDAYKAVDWDGLQQQDPDLAASEWRKFQLLKDQAGELAQGIQTKETEAAQARERESANLIAQGREVLAKEIPNWGPEVAGQLTEYGTKNFGFTAQEIAAVTDPRLIKLLHSAMQGAKTANTQAKVEKVLASQKTQPAPQVRSGASTSTKDPAKMSPAAYRKWRATQG